MTAISSRGWLAGTKPMNDAAYSVLE